MMQSTVRAYLQDLESGLMFGKCAGKNANIAKLHQNNVTDMHQRIVNFERLRICLSSHPLASTYKREKTKSSLGFQSNRILMMKLRIGLYRPDFENF